MRATLGERGSTNATFSPTAAADLMAFGGVRMIPGGREHGQVLRVGEMDCGVTLIE